jgi:penicillin amidase
MRRWIVRALAVFALLIALGAAAVFVYLRQSLPVMDGEARVAGISGPIEIVRDADAIPHVIAATKLDAMYGLGYVHAQDRLWQMEFQRRIGHGRLSEIFGEATVSQDRFLRTVGFGRAARSAWARLPADARQQIEAYVAGVNAFIAVHRGRRLPPEFTLLRFQPEPFTGEDVLVWVKMMAWDLSANYSLELMRHDMAARVGPERMAELLPPYDPDWLSIVSTPAKRAPATPPDEHTGHVGAISSSVELASAVAHGLSAGNAAVREFLLGGTREALGSNSWVVDGTLTASGKPMLANDPHLGTNIPSLWYLAHLSAGDFDVIGATLPGAPAFAIGRNRYIAWGETNVAADVEDLFLERVDSTGRTAEFQGVQEPIRIIPETIVVKGGAPIAIDVRVTRHGPLVSDAINANNAASTSVPTPPPVPALAFRWTALDEEDTTVVAFLKLNEARNWIDFTAALRHFVVPSQNFVYADVNGHIGYYAPGKIPVRAGGNGSRPAPGWTGEAEWIGFVPFDELPHVFDPPEHLIVAANHRPMPADYPHFIGAEWPDPYRAERILQLLTQRTRLTPDDFQAIQADVLSLHAKRLLPLLLANVRGEGDQEREAIDLLRTWDFQGTADSAAEAIFQAWFVHLMPAIAGDELGPGVSARYRGRFSYITRFATGILSKGSSAWCDDVATPASETCADSVTKAFRAAIADLNTRLGGSPARWRWDAVHHAVFPHQGLDAVRPLRRILSRSIPSRGDWSAVNVGPVSADRPYDQVSIPGYRQIVDLSPANDSRFADAVGQSGHFLSRHYDDFLPDWQAVRLKKMRMERSEIDMSALGTLRLVPATP